MRRPGNGRACARRFCCPLLIRASLSPSGDGAIARFRFARVAPGPREPSFLSQFPRISRWRVAKTEIDSLGRRESNQKHRRISPSFLPLVVRKRISTVPRLARKWSKVHEASDPSQLIADRLEIARQPLLCETRRPGRARRGARGTTPTRARYASEHANRPKTESDFVDREADGRGRGGARRRRARPRGDGAWIFSSVGRLRASGSSRSALAPPLRARIRVADRADPAHHAFRVYRFRARRERATPAASPSLSLRRRVSRPRPRRSPAGTHRKNQTL